MTGYRNQTVALAQDSKLKLSVNVGYHEVVELEVTTVDEKSQHRPFCYCRCVP